MQVVYLDNNATTKPDPQVVAAMVPFLQELYGNPSSAHRFGQRSRQAIDEARAQLADFLGCSDRELIFTGGGTEASNTAFRSLLAARAPRTVVVTSTVEHSATKQMCEKHVDAGLDVRSVGVHDDGTLDMDALASALDDDVAFCTMMWANNETGVLFDVAQIADICREKGVPFHCDATQALGKIPADFHRLGFDMATIASHKFHGPKGVGALFVRKGLRVDPLLVGGPQERARRGGTENVPGIVGLGKAAEVAKDKLPDMARVEKLRDKLEAGIAELCAPVRFNGQDAPRLPNTSNVGFEGLAAEAIVIALSEQGVCISAGAACSSGSMEASHVIQNMRVPEAFAHGSVRFSLGRMNTDADVDAVLAMLPGIIERLRDVMPVMA